MARSQLEWDIYQLIISYIDDDNMADDIAHDIIQLLISKGNEI